MEINIEILLIVLASSGVILVLIALFWGLQPLICSRRGVQGLGSQVSDANRENEKDSPKVSIVFYSQGDEEEMENFMDSIADQSYENYEVICVRDTNSETIKDSKERYEEKYPNLYMTFIPPRSFNLSRRKLAFTVGVKAAQGEIILLTDPECRPDSPRWIEEMCVRFADRKVDMVLGYVAYSFRSMAKIKRLYRSFLSLCASCMWISAARRGKPFRGDSCNMAFRRRMFMESGGYTASNFLHAGEDDLFVVNNAGDGNIVLQVNPEARMTVNYSTPEGVRTWERRRETLDFISHFLPRKPFVHSAISSCLQWISLIILVGEIILSIFMLAGEYDFISSLIYLIIGSFALLMLWIGDIIIYRQTACAYGSPRLLFTVPFFMLWKPIGNFLFRLRHWKSRRKNYTWEH